MIIIALTDYEKETIISFNEEESNVTVYTYNRELMKQIEKRKYQSVKDIPNGKRVGSKTYIIPKTCFEMTFLKKGAVSKKVNQKS